MNKQISYSIQIILCLLISVHAISQNETFDIITYTPPKDWKKEAKQGVVNYTDVNTTTGVFCVIAMYASRKSNGDPQKEFDNDWKELVVIPFKAEANPGKETQNADGWEIVSAAANVKLDGTDLSVTLTVITGFGKTISIRASMNDQSYVAQLNTLFESMELDKTKTASINSNNTLPVESTGAAGKFGQMIYITPSGWSEKKYQNAVEFRPKDIPADEILAMQILQPLNFSGSLDQALAKSYDEVVVMNNATKKNYAGGAEYQKTEAKISFNGWEYVQGSGGIQVENGTEYKSEYGLVLFVIKINNRFERVAILKSSKNCNYLSRYFSADRQVYQYAIDRFLFSLHFTDGVESSLQPGSAIGSGIIGVWQGISLQTAATAGIRYNVYLPIFLTNGQAYFGPKFPTEGLDELDTRIPPELHSRDWGTYTFSNGRGVLKMPYADIPLRIENGKLIITANKTDHKFFQMPSVDGARFSGTYVMSEAYEKIPVITFSADGSFSDNGAIKVLYHEYTDCLNPGLLPGSGTYEVKNYSIWFNYTDGRKIKLAFLGTGYDKSIVSPDKLQMSFDDNILKRQ